MSVIIRTEVGPGMDISFCMGVLIWYNILHNVPIARYIQKMSLAYAEVKLLPALSNIYQVL